jgi:hypothetical protein
LDSFSPLVYLLNGTTILQRAVTPHTHDHLKAQQLSLGNQLSGEWHLDKGSLFEAK